MQIDNKFEIGEQVRWGPIETLVTSIRLAGSPNNILYDVSYFDSNGIGVTSSAYEIELKKLTENGMGFRSKEE